MIVDNELKQKTLEFYSFQLQEQLFKKLAIKKTRKELEKQYSENLNILSSEEKKLEKTISLFKKKIQDELDDEEKEDTLGE